MHATIPFVNREEELRVLEKMSYTGRYLPLYIYGPEGCGKTRLMKELVNLLNRRENYITLYIDTHSPTRTVEEALKPTIQKIIDIVGEVMEGVQEPIGKSIALLLSKILNQIAGKIRVKGKHLTIIIDEVSTSIGLEKTSWYLKYLQNLSETLLETHKPESILIIATTSEGQSLSEVMRHTYTDVKLIWNLNEESAKKLLLELGISSEKKQDEIWRLTGGNPRAIIEIVRDYEGDINAWKEKISNIRITPMLKQVKEKGLIKHLVKAVETPDDITETLEQILIQHNLIIYKAPRTLTNSKVEENSELGIGKYYAWQIPVYREVLKEIL